MERRRIHLLTLIILLLSFSCQKEIIDNRDALILGKWDCIDYADSISGEFEGKPPVFISHLYESGYVFKKNDLMWTRNKDGDKKVYTDKRVECKWLLSDDKLSVNLVFPGDSIEIYDIIDLTRKALVLKGNKGFWAGNKRTLIFSKA